MTTFLLRSNSRAPIGGRQSGALASRARATRRIALGAGGTLLGGGLVALGVAAPAALGVWPLAGAVVGTIVSGVGLATLGTSAGHLFRFGRPRPALVLAGVAGLGVSLVAAGLSTFPAGFGVWPALAHLGTASWATAAGFAVFVALLTLGAVVRWMVGEGEMT